MATCLSLLIEPLEKIVIEQFNPDYNRPGAEGCVLLAAILNELVGKKGGTQMDNIWAGNIGYMTYGKPKNSKLSNSEFKGVASELSAILQNNDLFSGNSYAFGFLKEQIVIGYSFANDKILPKAEYTQKWEELRQFHGL